MKYEKVTNIVRPPSCKEQGMKPGLYYIFKGPDDNMSLRIYR